MSEYRVTSVIFCVLRDQKKKANSLASLSHYEVNTLPAKYHHWEGNIAPKMKEDKQRIRTKILYWGTAIPYIHRVA